MLTLLLHECWKCAEYCSPPPVLSFIVRLCSSHLSLSADHTAERQDYLQSRARTPMSLEIFLGFIVLQIYNQWWAIDCHAHSDVLGSWQTHKKTLHIHKIKLSWFLKGHKFTFLWKLFTLGLKLINVSVFETF